MAWESVATALPWTENISTSAFFNFSNSTDSTDSDWELVYIIIPPYIFILTVLGLLFNGFVLFVFAIHKDKLTVAEIYLSNLAVADFFLLCGIPFWAMHILNHHNWLYGNALCKTVDTIMIVNFYTSIYTLVMISIDRYLAIVKTMTAVWLRRTLYAKIICPILWIQGILLSTPTIIHRKTVFDEEENITDCVLDYPEDSYKKVYYQILFNVMGFLLPVLFIVFCSCNIIRVLHRRKLNRDFHNTNDSKSILLLCAVTLLFLLCWGPIHAFTLIGILCDFKVLDGKWWFKILDVGGQVAVYLGFLNSTLNPLLYVFYGQYFWKKVYAIYRRARHYRRESDMTAYQRSVASTYINRTQQIKPTVIFNANNQTA